MLIVAFTSSPAFAQAVASSCGTLSSPGQYGPYDFRTTDRDKVQIVLIHHFLPADEALLPTKLGPPGGDIDYTLRALPNYHRALIAMMRLGEKEKTPQPKGSTHTIDCWFQRALLFRPDDAVVRMIYSTYLNSKGRLPDANTQLEFATAYAKDSAFTHYNIGLHYLDLKNYDMAIVQAHRAMALGWTQTELRDQLQSVGKWHEPAELPTTPAADSASAAQTK
ncbi:MAG: ABC transporter permease [Burkholderiaceae bacterium]|nr:ABC transporter permease [Burkholderiaceae bacterium]